MRIRPLAQRELNHGSIVSSTTSGEVVVNGNKQFSYNHVFDSAPQPIVFETMGRPQLEALLEG